LEPYGSPEKLNEEEVKDETVPTKIDGPVTVKLEEFVEAEPIIEDKEEARGTTLEENSLASSWEELKDPNTGVIYYYNSETGATQWDKPNTNIDRHQRTEDNTSINQEGVNQKSESTPSVLEKETESFWEEITDSARNKTYYYNSATGVTQWDKPEESSASTEKQKDKSSIKNTSTDINAEEFVSTLADEYPSKPVSHSKYIFTIELY